MMRSPRLSALIVALLSLCSCAAGAEEASSSLQELVSDLLRAVSEIRGLPPPPGGVKVFEVNSSWISATRGPRGWPTRGELAEEAVFIGLLLAPPTFSLRAGEERWASTFLAAASGSSVYVNADLAKLDDPSLLEVLAHELAHVLQGANLALPRAESLDEELALSALVEGDAGLTAKLFCESRGCSHSPPIELEGLDDLYLALKLFPYAHGERFARFLHAVGGWALVNEAYSRPPPGTKHVMFPELYLELLEVGSERSRTEESVGRLSRPTLVEKLGAFAVYLIASRGLSEREALSLAESWEWDRVVVSPPRWALLVEWRIALSSPDDAEALSVASSSRSSERARLLRRAPRPSARREVRERERGRARGARGRRPRGRGIRRG